MNELFEKIINGKSVGVYQLGWTMDKLKEELRGNYIEESLNSHYTLIAENIKFWVSKKEGTVSQIMVFGRHDGKFLEKIGIGSNISDIVRNDVRYSKEGYVYVFLDYPGICFELEDIDEWDEYTAPIESISVFSAQ